MTKTATRDFFEKGGSLIGGWAFRFEELSAKAQSQKSPLLLLLFCLSSALAARAATAPLFEPLLRLDAGCTVSGDSILACL